MKIYFAGAENPGSNTAVLADYIINNTLRGSDVTFNPNDGPFDLAFTNNGRLVEHIQAKLKINLQHGNLFLGDTKPEPQYGIKLATSSSESEKTMMISNGFDPDNVLVTGQPRMDRLWRLQKEQNIKGKYLKSKGMDTSKLTVLYTPTYSRGAFGMGEKLFLACSNNIEEDKIGVQCFIKACTNYNLIIRLHKYQKRFFGSLIPEWLKEELSGVEVHDNETEPDSMPPLLSADLLVTDFSSITADFLALNKPVVFIDPHVGWKYTDKWHAQKQERTCMGTIAYNSSDLKEILSVGKVKFCSIDMINKYQPFFDGQCCKRVWDGVLERCG